MTHYKWYDYKHAHTTYRKQLTNNTKQTDKTKRQKKRKKRKRKKEKQTRTKRKEKKKNKTTRTKTSTPLPPPPPKKEKKKRKEKKQQCIHDVDDIQLIHTNLSTAASGIHLRIKRTIGEGGGGDPYTFILLLSRHQNKRREYTMELTHIFEITLSK